MIQNRWIVLHLTALGVIMSMTAWFSATAVIPDISRVIDFSPSQITWLNNAVQIGFVVGALSTSFFSLADVMRPQKFMAIATVFAGIANAAMLLEPSANIIIISRLFTGVALSGVYPPSMKFIASWFVKGRGLAMGFMVGALTLGSALPHFVRAIDLGFDWQIVIVVSSVLCLIAGLIFAIFLTEGPERATPAKIDPRQLKQIIKNKPVMLANFGYFGHMWELYAMWGWFLSFAIAAKETMSGGWNASVLTFAVVALGAPSCILAGIVADRFGRGLTAAGCMIISGTCAVLIGMFFDGPAWLFILVASIWGFTVVADSAQFSASVSEHADKSLMGTALAFQMGIGFAITIFVIWLMPHLVELFGGWQWTFAILAIGPIIGTISMLMLHRYERVTARGD